MSSLSTIPKPSFIAEVPSSSDPTTKYHIYVGEGGRFECDCPDYQYRRKALGQDCKHIKMVKEAYE